MKKGFTLIELLVVVAIIGILATIVLININSVRQNKECEEAGYERDSNACKDLLEIKIEEPKKEKSKKETNLEVAKRVCPEGILALEGDPDSTWRSGFKVTCK